MGGRQTETPMERGRGGVRTCSSAVGGGGSERSRTGDLLGLSRWRRPSASASGLRLLMPATAPRSEVPGLHPWMRLL